jgi:integrase/recombinase XerD
MKRHAEKAGITGVRISPHGLRFTFATLFLRNGGSITNLQQILGHTTLAMSRRYAAVADQDAFHDSMQFSPIAQLSRRGK